MGHDHGHASAATAGAKHRKPLIIAFGLTAAYMLVELVTGLVTGSPHCRNRCPARDRTFHGSA